MGVKNSSQVDILFDGMVQLLKNQQEQLQSLLQERKFLEERIKTQHERWVSDVRLYEDHIAQMKNALVEKDMACLHEAAKSDLMIGLEHREASLLKLKLEQTEDELLDFKAGFDYLSQIPQKNSKEIENKMEENIQGDLNSSASKRLHKEIKRLKFEYEKLSSEKHSEISALLKEKSFVWNQYSVLESNLTVKLKRKQTEVDQANDKIAKVLGSVELLQASDNEKDDMIGSLKSKLAEVEVDRDKLKEELSKLAQELESMKNSRSAQVTPALKHCNAAPKPSNRQSKNSHSKGSNIVVKKEISSGKAVVSLKDAEKDRRSLKRKADEVTSILETPRLFSSTFKVPKLKTPSALVT